MGKQILPAFILKGPVWTEAAKNMPKNNIITGSLQAALSRNIEKGAGRAVLHAMGGVLLGLLASRAEIFGKCAPFGIAAVAAASPGYGIFVLIGAMLGYMLPQGPEYSIRYVAAVIAVFLFKWVLASFEGLSSHPAFAPCLAALATAITGAAVVFGGGFVAYDVLIFLIETLLCGCAAVFFGHAANYINKPTGLWGLTQHELISITISLCVLLLALERVQLSGISLGRIAAVFVVLCAARYGRETGGSIMGISAGMVLSLGGGASSGMLVGYGFGGLIAGVFAPLGRLWTTVAFILANAVACITFSSSVSQTLTVTYEVATASVIFMLLPEKVLCRISVLFAPVNSAGERHAREAICDRLTDAANALDEISEMVSQVHGKLNKIGSADISLVFSEAAEDTCKKCGMHMYCWGTVYNDTMNTLNDVTDTLRKNRTLTREDIPKHFAARCCKLSDFVGTINRCYAEFSARKAAELKSEQLRRLMAPGFSNTACLMRDIAADFSNGKRKAGGSDRVRAALAACGLCASSSRLFVDARGRLTIETEVDGKNTRVNREKLLEALHSTCGRTMDGPRISQNEESGSLRLLFTQKPQYSVKFGEAAIQKTGETLCGDACESFVDEQGRAMLLLSDGMGCGGSAAIDSNLTVGLMSRLLRCGFGFDEAAKIAGTAMMVKSGDESFSTLDIASIDLFDGSTTFLKAGAPPTYIRRCGRVERIEPSSMPIGILPEVKLEKANARLRAGDVVVVLSDGAVSQDDSFIISALEKFSGEPRAFAKHLAEKAKELRSDGHDDDITVMAAAIV